MLNQTLQSRILLLKSKVCGTRPENNGLAYRRGQGPQKCSAILAAVYLLFF